jgi:hypothetical protein
MIGCKAILRGFISSKAVSSGFCLDETRIHTFWIDEFLEE